MPRWPRGLHAAAGSTRAWGGRSYQIPRPAPELYRLPVRSPIAQNAAQTTVAADGSATVQIGPQGLGTRWFPTQANVATTTGAADTSTVALYLGAQTQANLLGGSSYAGGLDTIGINTGPLTPGDLITAVWSGGHAGDTATLTIYGDQEVLGL